VRVRLPLAKLGPSVVLEQANPNTALTVVPTYLIAAEPGVHGAQVQRILMRTRHIADGGSLIEDKFANPLAARTEPPNSTR
jgi:hypothetical protein